MSQPHNEESEFKEFIDQINALQHMQGTEQEELNQQRKLNVDLMEDLIKNKRKLEVEIGKYTRLNFRHAELQKDNQEHQQRLNGLTQENDVLLAKEIDLQHALDTLKRKHLVESRFYRTHIETLDRLARIQESYLASLECSRRFKELQHELSLTQHNVAALLDEDSALDHQLASGSSQYEDERTLTHQATELSHEVVRLNERVAKAKEELQAAQNQASDRSAMQHEDYTSVMAEVVQLDRESQQLESLLEQERMEAEALKFELTEFDKQ